MARTKANKVNFNFIILDNTNRIDSLWWEWERVARVKQEEFDVYLKNLFGLRTEMILFFFVVVVFVFRVLWLVGDFFSPFSCSIQFSTSINFWLGPRAYGIRTCTQESFRIKWTKFFWYAAELKQQEKKTSQYSKFCAESEGTTKKNRVINFYFPIFIFGLGQFPREILS